MCSTLQEWGLCQLAIYMPSCTPSSHYGHGHRTYCGRKGVWLAEFSILLFIFFTSILLLYLLLRWTSQAPGPFSLCTASAAPATFENTFSTCSFIHSFICGWAGLGWAGLELDLELGNVTKRKHDGLENLLADCNYKGSTKDGNGYERPLYWFVADNAEARCGGSWTRALELGSYMLSIIEMYL
ncbi:hypothetical protein DFH27DRAFT_368640 [Peziza echinospora]|nr:hypothetical protein DFH27DRAFT_368640 [Peziza echinospora]